MSNGNYQETHERILESGLAAFLEEGFEKANLRRICKAAGVTTGAFYKHFKDKEALFSELVEPLANMIRKAYAQGVERGFAGYDERKPVTPEQVRAALEAEGCTDFMEDPEEGSLAFPPRFLETARSVRRPDGEPVQIQRCFLVYEVGEDGGYLIDVALRPA